LNLLVWGIKQITRVDLLKLYSAIYGFVKTLMEGKTPIYQAGENLGRGLGLTINLTNYGVRRK